MPNAELLTPGGIPELTAALQRATPSSRLLAGGTDLMRSMHQDHWEPDLLIDLSGVRELDYVTLEDGTLHVGSMTTFAELQADPLVRRHARCLAEAAAQVGSAQIRNVATVGGNIANASPCADTVTALVALGADVRTIDGDGVRSTRPLTEITVGSGRTSLAPDEAITEVGFAALGADQRTTFAKIGSRSTVTVARLSMALVVTFDGAAGMVSGVRVALGAVGEAAFRDARLEELLEGRPANAVSARLFAEGCMDAVRRAIPGRYSLPYKQHAVVGLAYDAWNALGLCERCEPAWG
jgi:CO/xanthine dehydrogenase FAD-binding subunit